MFESYRYILSPVVMTTCQSLGTSKIVLVREESGGERWVCCLFCFWLSLPLSYLHNYTCYESPWKETASDMNDGVVSVGLRDGPK